MQDSFLKNKKILILGANYETIPLIKTAKALGIFTIVTDYNHNAPAKKFADQSFDIDCMNVDELKKLCVTENVDGVLVGVADALVVPYQQLCERLNFPCYLTKKHAIIFSNKLVFNEYCKKFLLNPIPNYEIDLNSLSKEISKIQFPVFVKPADGNSGKGASICKNKSELEKGIIRAKKNSKSGKFLVEKYMQTDDILIYFTFQNGNYYLSALGDRFTIQQTPNGSRVCVGAIYPSKYSELYLKTVHEKLLKMFKSLKVKNGVMLISAFVENNNFYLYDPGFRLQGEAPDIHIVKDTGIDQKQALINFAITGKMNIGKQPKQILGSNNYFYVTIWILLKPGKIKTLRGLDKLAQNPKVFFYLQRFYEGDQVTEEMIGTERQVFMRIYCQFPKNENIVKEIKKIENSIDITDENSHSMKIVGLSNALKNRGVYAN